MDESLLALLQDQDTSTWITQEGQMPEFVAIGRKCHEIGKRLYWEQRNLERCIEFLRTGALWAMRMAEQDAVHRYEILSVAKAMYYDLASFTWRGWDEPGIDISDAEAAIGLEAARSNLRLGEELNKGDLPLSRAHWVLAAHLLAAHDYTGAVWHFERAAEYGRKAEAEAEALLAAAFAALTSLVERPANQEAAAHVEKIKAKLASVENGQFFRSQIETAASVFGL